MDLNLVINAIKAEMKPSMGCTEPVALALAVSRTCEHLDAPTQKLEMLISSNIFKNMEDNHHDKTCRNKGIETVIRPECHTQHAVNEEEIG